MSVRETIANIDYLTTKKYVVALEYLDFADILALGLLVSCLESSVQHLEH